MEKITQKIIRVSFLGMLDLLSFSLSMFIGISITATELAIADLIRILLLNLIIKISFFSLFNNYSTLWKYASIEELLKILTVNVLGSISLFLILGLANFHLPVELLFITFILDVAFTGGIRILYRILRRLKSRHFVGYNKKNVLIVGAGDGGAIVLKEYKDNPAINANVIAFIDDDLNKRGKYINGVKIIGGVNDIPSIVDKNQVDEIVVAMPSASGQKIKNIIKECHKTQCKIKILPSLSKLMDDKYFANKIRDVQIEDLLGREPVDLHISEISSYLQDKRVLVTGGGGSIGSELCRQIANFNPKELVILDIYENSIYDLQNELRKKKPQLNFKIVVASIRDKKRMDEVFRKYKPQVVFHAAAHKHVPLMEENPSESVKNNIFGTHNLVTVSDAHSVERFVMISTDKAVNPTNIMGATKRFCEMMIQAIDRVSRTKFVAVRFGNVLGSNGSVIPLFKKQIAEGGPVSVTHPDIIRYFMTISEATQLVIQAGAMAKGGEIFILDMGEPVKILDLAKDLIRLSGFEPGKDIPIEIIGLRPGEKLYEELLMAEEGKINTAHEKIFIGKPLNIEYKFILRHLSLLREELKNENCDIKEVMMKIVSTYKPTDNRGDEVAISHNEVVMTEPNR